MPREFKAPQAYSDRPRPPIALVPVTSNKVAAIGYDEATQTLAVTFPRGAGAIYHYPNVSKETHQALVQAESIGKYFGAHIQDLPYEKFYPDPVAAAEDGPQSAVAAAAGGLAQTAVAA
ncbi:KTSC domain-containing protein [Rhodoferax sp. GW822-FHT02A01]|uniref:KTSC domain-containing protein n=1 Tax=Rhodoferax sp. GW822-FHT02A01 TaxID=3141537 RepID=UPI00315DC6BD